MNGGKMEWPPGRKEERKKGRQLTQKEGRKGDDPKLTTQLGERRHQTGAAPELGTDGGSEWEERRRWGTDEVTGSGSWVPIISTEQSPAGWLLGTCSDS